jgi:hypothetical protein
LEAALSRSHRIERGAEDKMKLTELCDRLDSLRGRSGPNAEVFVLLGQNELRDPKVRVNRVYQNALSEKVYIEIDFEAAEKGKQP